MRPPRTWREETKDLIDIGAASGWWELDFEARFYTLMQRFCGLCQIKIHPDNQDALTVFFTVLDQVEHRSVPSMEAGKEVRVVSKMISNTNIDVAIKYLSPRYPGDCFRKVKILLREYF